MNDEFLAVRIPSDMKKGLDAKFPEVRDRNNVIRALIQKYLRNEISVTKYEIEIANS